MIQFQIPSNEFLTANTNAFYHVLYTGRGAAGNPDYLNDLKNTYDSFSQHKLQYAAQELLSVLEVDLHAPAVIAQNEVDLFHINEYE